MESKIDGSVNSSLFAHSDYRIIRRDRKKGGSGMPVYIRRSITALRRGKLEPDGVESICLDSLDSLCLDSLSSRPVNIGASGPITKKNLKILRYFRLPPNLAHRKLLDLANHTPSFMPYKAVVLEIEFFESGREMASSSGSSRRQTYTLDKVLQRVLDEEDDNQGTPSDEESDLDRQLYDMDNNSRKVLVCFFSGRFGLQLAWN